MCKSNTFRLLLFLWLGLFFSIPGVFAGQLKSKHFDVTIEGNIDNYELLEKLNANYFLHLNGMYSSSKLDEETIVKDALDALYVEVSDILDIHMYSFEISLVIVPDKVRIAEIIAECGGKYIEVPSFYYYEENTIYISWEDFTIGMFAHEVAHAVISHYFVVPPPEKLQEVLAGYVEYSIRKSSSSQISH